MLRAQFEELKGIRAAADQFSLKPINRLDLSNGGLTSSAAGPLARLLAATKRGEEGCLIEAGILC